MAHLIFFCLGGQRYNLEHPTVEFWPGIHRKVSILYQKSATLQIDNKTENKIDFQLQAFFCNTRQHFQIKNP